MVEVPEVLEAPGATNHARAVIDPGADNSTPAAPQAGSCTTPAQAIASAAALPTVPPTVHPPISLTDLITDEPPSGTYRTAW